MSITQFSPVYLDTLINEANLSPRLRQHRNVHQSYDDPSQRFMNAIGVGRVTSGHIATR